MLVAPAGSNKKTVSSTAYRRRIGGGQARRITRLQALSPELRDEIIRDLGHTYRSSDQAGRLNFHLLTASVLLAYHSAYNGRPYRREIDGHMVEIGADELWVGPLAVAEIAWTLLRGSRVPEAGSADYADFRPFIRRAEYAWKRMRGTWFESRRAIEGDARASQIVTLTRLADFATDEVYRLPTVVPVMDEKAREWATGSLDDYVYESGVDVQAYEEMVMRAGAAVYDRRRDESFRAYAVERDMRAEGLSPALVFTSKRGTRRPLLRLQEALFERGIVAPIKGDQIVLDISRIIIRGASRERILEQFVSDVVPNHLRPQVTLTDTYAECPGELDMALYGALREASDAVREDSRGIVDAAYSNALESEQESIFQIARYQFSRHNRAYEAVEESIADWMDRHGVVLRPWIVARLIKRAFRSAYLAKMKDGMRGRCNFEGWRYKYMDVVEYWYRSGEYRHVRVTSRHAVLTTKEARELYWKARRAVAI